MSSFVLIYTLILENGSVVLTGSIDNRLEYQVISAAFFH